MGDLNKYKEPQKAKELRLIAAIFLISSCTIPFLSMKNNPWVLLVLILLDGVILVMGLYLLSRHSSRRTVLFSDKKENNLEQSIVPASSQTSRLVIEIILNIFAGLMFIGFGEVFYIWIFKKDSFTSLDYVLGSALGLLFLGWQSYNYLWEINLSRETRGRELLFSQEKLFVAASIIEGPQKGALLRSNLPYFELPWEKLSRINVNSPLGNRRIPAYSMNLKMAKLFLSEDQVFMEWKRQS